MPETVSETGPAATVSNPEEVRERFYTLVYRRGAQVKEKNFPFAGKLDGAIQRGREHCRKMGNIRFVVVRPFIVDLDYQEEIKALTGKSPDDEMN
jgi:hypothetical protein